MLTPFDSILGRGDGSLVLGAARTALTYARIALILRHMTALDPRADGRRARRLFSTGLMSDTKWHELFRVIVDACDPVRAHVVVKFVAIVASKRMLFSLGLQPPRPFVETTESGPNARRTIERPNAPGDHAVRNLPIGGFPVERQGPYTWVSGCAGKIPACS